MLNIAGFYSPRKKSVRRTESSGKANGVSGKVEIDNDRGPCEEEHIELVEQVESLELENTSEQEDGKEDDDDDEGWITPENLQQVCEEMGSVLDDVPQLLSVGCITTDFAMQARNDK